MKINSEFFPLTQVATRFVNQLAQCRRLNISVLEASEHHVLLELPYSQDIIGDPDTGVIHGGVVTTLIDTASGTSVVSAILAKYESLEISPTLDLRVDYMKPAEPDKPLYAIAECYRLSANVAFTRAIAYQDSVDDPIAHAVGSFMRISPEMVGEEFRQALMGDTSTSDELAVNKNLSTGTSSKTDSEVLVDDELNVHDIVKRAIDLNDYSYLLAKVPYTQFIGMSVNRFGDEMVFKLPQKDDNIGNPILPAIHGGVIAGFMEMSAIVQLMVFMQAKKVPKIIDFSIDYLRAGLHQDTFAECKITRQGRRVAHVTINCWQTNRKQLIATARAHFLLDQ
ncbi:PaaI family thioesterase [Shewanella sp. 1_MG-2023]|uniref:PaaI family thioesterase n=2 Tax=Shewanella TaxID=22 RepID=A0ABT0KPH2_9GAMM|nr:MULTISPECIES: PaaI family thioesterase [Shewanella]MCC4831422.1 PaaI family thioesterase [Shewanella sp. 10N.7]MDO6771757.1 PaaI family thioesterase [Shewanella sp. 2_MG-2023]MCL1045260.1 PaaI family thioesterase [Shewanella electrodiphila]MDO6611902.1 PaaI family thioesterase [Shewanella sp. 7_MG-2023]MDO6793983.1 PaaI family thioesterase [Shewanella sp. 1_MG-2023]